MAIMVTEISSNLFIPALLFLSLVYLIAKQLKTPFSSRSAPRLPPGPYAWPILGNALQMGRNPHVTLANLAKIYGPLFSVRLGSQLVVVASSQEAAAEILKNSGSRFLRMLTNILMSRDLVNFELESVEGGMSEVIRNIFEVGAAPNISDLFPVLAPFDLQNLRKKSKELYLRCSAMFEPIIKERRERKMIDEDDASSQQDFLDTLIRNGSTDEHINILLLV
ncbi:hypothetical protein OIU76_022547 [Salix suchowensis]|nr:hypothetical protein OIU76_022547 [Salix suchowensis]